jgi:hypothetical protein
VVVRCITDSISIPTGKTEYWERISGLVSGFATKDGILMLANLLQLCRDDPAITFSAAARLHLVAAKVLFQFDVGKDPSKVNGKLKIVSAVVTRICTLLTNFLRRSKLCKVRGREVL